MKHLALIILVIFLIFTNAFAQKQKLACNCPKNNFTDIKGDTSFTFKNGKSIVLCGTKDLESSPVTFSEFVLAECGKDSVIDFWGADVICQMKFKKDTLQVQEVVYLPVGKNFEIEDVIWSIEKFYFEGDKIARSHQLNRAIKKYNQTEIQKVINIFKKMTGGIDDEKMEFCYHLFMGAISGDAICREYFLRFKQKTGELDGGYAEEYEDLKAMLELWEKGE